MADEMNVDAATTPTITVTPAFPRAEAPPNQVFAEMPSTPSIVPPKPVPPQARLYSEGSDVQKTHEQQEASPKGWWQKLDIFLWGRGQELLAGVLIIAVLFYTIVSAIELTKTIRLEKNIAILNTKLDSASEKVTSWGENSAKAVALLEGQGETFAKLNGNLGSLVTALNAATEGTLANQKTVADIATGVNAVLVSNEANKILLTESAVQMEELGYRVDGIGITLVVNKEAAKEVKPAAKPATEKAATTPAAPATAKKHHWWALWLF